MSVSPSFPHGAPSLAEVLITRTFAKPTNPFVDGEFLEALEHADDDKPAVVVAVKPSSTGAGAAPQDHHDGPPAAPVAQAKSGTRVDVRA